MVTFFAAQRTNCCNPGGQQFAVYLDGTLLGTFNPPLNGVYLEYSTAAFTTTTGSHTLKFVGLNPGGQAGFIDHVRIMGAPVIGNGVQWLVSDHLGTPRMVIDQTGALANIKRHDYLPFGEEIFAGSAGRTAENGYAVGDGVRQQFTQKERDVETGLDYFINRYYSSMQGRFTSPDAPFADQWEEEPQSWNLYSYVGNQPLNHTDPFGLWKEVECTSGKGQCWVSDNEKDTITSLARLLGVDANQLYEFLQKPKVIKLGQEFDISGFWSWRAGITPGTEPAVVFVDLVDESDIPGDRYSIDVTIGPRFPIRNLGKKAAQKLWNERGKIAGQLTKEDNRLLREFFGQGTLGKLKHLKDFKIPQGLTKQALERYAEVARRAVESGNDKSGVQRDRLELIEKALKTIKD